MNLVFKISWRNIWRHKGKSFVIGFILFLGASLMTVGNGFISGMERGLNKNIIQLFTGDLVLISSEHENNEVFFSMAGKPLKTLKNFTAIRDLLSEEESVAAYLPVALGKVYVFNPGSELGAIQLLGVEFQLYSRFFPGGVRVTEGRMPHTGERGILISEKARESIYNSMDFWLLPQEGKVGEGKLPKDFPYSIELLDIQKDLVFMGANISNSALDIRVPVTGIFKYQAFNKIWGGYSLVDIESFREAHNYITSDDSIVELSVEEQEILSAADPEQLFFSSELVTEIPIQKEESFPVKQDTDVLSKKTTPAIDRGSYNLAFIRLKDGFSHKDVIQRLNGLFHEQNLQVKVVNWKEAVGDIGSITGMIKGALNLFILVIYFVAVIMIMNTLSMAALERVSELGAMRAIGAQRKFLCKMQIYETGILSFFFGGLGIITGFFIILFLRMADIIATNEFLQLAFGGDKLNPVLGIEDIVLCLVELGFVTVLAVIFPLLVVRKITPLEAVIRD